MDRGSLWKMLVAALGVVLPLAQAPQGFATTQINSLPQGRPVPERVREAMQEREPGEPPPYGYRRLLKQVRQNRQDLRSGRLSPQDVARAGGTAITGTKLFPVFPFLYANTSSTPYPSSNLETQLFDGPWTTGTMKEYYEEISYGLFSVDGYVDPWYQVSQNDTYYEGNNNGLRGSGSTAATDELILEVLTARDPSIDFSQWDNDGPDGVPNSGDDDGYVDFIAFVSPEPGGECQNIPGNANMWSHRNYLSSWGSSAYETDDVSNTSGFAFTKVNGYLMSSGVDCNSVDQSGIGTFCHEFGHALGISDLYDTSQNSEGLGHWCLMAAGNWNSQDHPAHMSAWCKERIGWLTYQVVSPSADVCLDPVETSPTALRLWLDGAEGPEYFVVENRQAIGFDDQVAGTGLVIYHVDEDVYDDNDDANAVNANEAHKAIDVECADATTAEHVADADDLDTSTNGDNRGDSGDVWGPSTQTTFDGSSTPDSRSYLDIATNISVTNIATGTDGQMCASVDVGSVTSADVCIQDCSSDGCAETSTCDVWWASPDLWIDNDDDGIDDLPADGTDNHLWFRVHNKEATAVSGVTIELYYGDPAMGQLWPSTGTLIGSKQIPIIDAGGMYENFVVFNYPDPPADVEHYCLAAVVRHDLDPQNSEYPPEDDNVAQVNHQILVARADGSSSLVAGTGNGSAICNGTFSRTSKIYLMNPTSVPRLLRVRLGNPPSFGDWNLPLGWFIDANRDTMAEFELAAGQRDSLIFLVGSQTAEHGQTAHLPLTLMGRPKTGGPETAMGGVIMDYRIDCHDPRGPLDGRAEWIDVARDDQVGANVRVSWSPVTFDLTDGPETVVRYEVYRSDTGGTPETLVGQVTVDAATTLEGLQWYDNLDEDCAITYIYRIRALDGTGGAGAYSDPIYLSCTLAAPANQPQSTFVDGTMTGLNCATVPCWPGIRGTDLSTDPDPNIAAMAIDDNWNTPPGDSLTVRLLGAPGAGGTDINWKNGFDKSVGRGLVLAHVNPAYTLGHDVPRMIFRLFDPLTKTWSPFDSTELDADDARLSGGAPVPVGSLFRVDWPPRDKVDAGASLPGGFFLGGFRWGAAIRTLYSDLAFLPRGARLQFYFKSVRTSGTVTYKFSPELPPTAGQVPETVDLPLLPGSSIRAPDIMEFDVLPGAYAPGAAGTLLEGRINTPILNLDGAYRQWSYGQDPVVQALRALGVRADRYRLVPIVGAGHNIGGHELPGKAPTYSSNFFPNQDEYSILDSLSAWYRILIQSQHSRTATVLDDQDARLVSEWWNASTGSSGGDRCILATGDDFFDALSVAGGSNQVALSQTVFGVAGAFRAWSGALSNVYPMIDDQFAGVTAGPGLSAAGEFTYPVDGSPSVPGEFDRLTKMASTDAANFAFYPNAEVAGVANMSEWDAVTDRDRNKALGYAISFQSARQTGIPPNAPNFPHAGAITRMRILYKFLTSCRGLRSSSPADTETCWPCPSDDVDGLTSEGNVGNWRGITGFVSTKYGPLYPIQDSQTATGVPYVVQPTVSRPNLLYPNRPNPFNPTTTIPFHLERGGRVQVRVFDISGRLIRVLLDAERGAGDQIVVWDGRTQQGTLAPSGIYFYRIVYADGTYSARKMTMLR